MRLLLLFLIIILFFSCSKKKAIQFTEVAQESGITFVNSLQPTEQMNPYTYRSFYNGGGVSIGDINNDKLLDIYFTGNQAGNRLYLNKGDFKFDDITDKANVSCVGAWSTGSTFVDANGDGLLDIYVCKSGNPDTKNRPNSLFINNGDLTFTDKAKEYGLDVLGLSVQAAFFDYDKDGDLDCYLLTNSFKSIGNFDVFKNLRQIPDPTGGGNRFYRNEGGKFVNYSEQSGIFRSAIGFGLGITIGDFNDDDWVDIYVSNDFFERDYLYLNNKEGAFVESLEAYFESISMGSMGADYADLNNDGRPELFVTEMLPGDLTRKKSKTVYDNWNKYQWNVENGYHHQFSRNVLQSRVSNGQYMEIGRLAGVAATEWSWGALIFDMDNDGFRDIFVANGIYKDLLDRDYLAYTSNGDVVRNIIRKEKNPVLKLIELIPQSQFLNYAFRNNQDFQFENQSQAWGFVKQSYSTGSSYGDLDNDGDLDLVINNINKSAFLYKNNSDRHNTGYIEFDFRDSNLNTNCIGTKVTAYCMGGVYYGENFISRGFQSSVSSRIHFGLPHSTTIDSVLIEWPDFGDTVIYGVKSNQLIHIARGLRFDSKRPKVEHLNSGINLERIPIDSFKHVGSLSVDFDRERLLPIAYNNESPGLAHGDVDNDGKDEIYIAGGVNQTGVIYQYRDKKFRSKKIPETKKYINNEESRPLFFEADNDGDLDLYLAFGGRAYGDGSKNLQDVILFNDGNGNFNESKEVFPFQTGFATSAVVPIDFDNDGDLDLAVGERFNPIKYGLGGRAYLLENTGRGEFIDITELRAPILKSVGMVTDISVADFDLDGRMDIVLVGDWSGIRFLRNTNLNFIDVSDSFHLRDTQGWWHAIETADLNSDGYLDFVIGNVGYNSFFKSGDVMYVSDFDGNGFFEQIYCSRIGELDYPVLEKDEVLSQLPHLKKVLLYYKDYSTKSIDQLFSSKQLEQAKQLHLRETASIMLLSNKGKYDKVTLPIEAQFAPVYSILLADINADGIIDALMGGNQFKVKPQFGRLDASTGWFFPGGLHNGRFNFSKGQALGVRGEIRDIERILINKESYVFFAINNGLAQIYQVKK